MSKHNQDAEETTHRTSKKIKKAHKIIAAVIAAILLLIILFLIWLYTGSVSGAKQKVFSSIPLPVALVEVTPISSVQLFDRIKLAEQILKETGQSSNDITGQILNQLVQSKKVEVMARQKNLKITDEDVEAAYQAVLAQFPNGNEEDLKKALEKTYGLDLKTFKNQAIRQTVMQDKLSLWFNEQESLNHESYQKARDLIKQLDSGTSFEEVAMKYNQDPASKDFAGDSGFVAFSDLLPEFQTGIKDLATNDKKLVVSRYGLHIVKVVAIEEKEIDGKMEKNYNLQQIFVKPNDFVKWFTDEAAKIRSIELI
jgi:parvulin-like peptidyl-prolyl isomerase